MNNTDSPANNKKSIVIYIVLALTLAVETMVVDWEIRLMVASVAIAMMVVVVWYHTWKTSFNDSVVAKIKKSKVLQCEADGEDIVVNNGEIVLKAKLINRPKKSSKRVQFIFEFVPKMLYNIQPEGWALLVAKCNTHFDDTTMKYYGDHLCCQVETIVESPKDFLKEYHFAMEKIGKTMQGFEANTEYVVKEYPTKEHRVGFVV